MPTSWLCTKTVDGEPAANGDPSEISHPSQASRYGSVSSFSSFSSSVCLHAIHWQSTRSTVLKHRILVRGGFLAKREALPGIKSDFVSRAVRRKKWWIPEQRKEFYRAKSLPLSERRKKVANFDVRREIV